VNQKKIKQIRLEEFLAMQTPIARRESVQLVAAGKVNRNGNPIKDITALIDPHQDVIQVEGQRVGNQMEYFYYKFHKPTDVISTMDDPNGRTNLKNYMKGVPPQITPIGRLDRDSEGLMLFTNDGNLSLKLSHPRFHIGKVYRVTVDKPLTEAVLDRLVTGFFLDDGPVKFDGVEPISDVSVNVTISEGRNRIVRRSFAVLGYTVKKLKRTAVGPIVLGELAAGRFVPLTTGELRQLDQILKFR